MTLAQVKAFLRTAAHVVLLRPLVQAFFGVTVTGRAHLRGLDRFVVVANHNSHLDVFLLFHVLPLRAIARTRAVADKRYFSRWRVLYAAVSFLFDPVWVTRGQPGEGKKSLERFRSALDDGSNMIIFPEGTRGTAGELAKFKSGTGRLLSESKAVPIVPVFLSGPERALPKSRAVPLPIWHHVVVGPPRVCTGKHRDITESLEEAVGELYQAESAHRHHRRLRRERHRPVVAVLGIDGSGKSTVSRGLARGLSAQGTACLVSDRLEFYEDGNVKAIQPLMTERLRQLAGEYAKRAKSLERYRVPKFAELVLRELLSNEVQRWYAPGVVVHDGSPILNIAGWSVLYTRNELTEESYAKGIAVLAGRAKRGDRQDPLFERFPELTILERLKLKPFRIPELVLLIDVSPATAVERIAARGKVRQVHETESRLAQLRDSYQTVCEVVHRRWGIATARLDADRPIEEVVSEGLRYARGLLWVDGQRDGPAD